MRGTYVGFLGNEVFHVKLWQKYEEEEATNTKKKEVEVKVNLTPLNFQNMKKVKILQIIFDLFVTKSQIQALQIQKHFKLQIDSVISTHFVEKSVN